MTYLRFAFVLSIFLSAAVPCLAQTPAQASGQVWHDLDRDGLRDPGEPGIEGIRLRMRSAIDLTVQQSVVTGADGSYATVGDPMGFFFLEIVVPNDRVLTLMDAGDDAIDSDFHRGDRTSPVFQDAQTFDAGLAVPELAPLFLEVTLGAVADGETLTVPVEVRNPEPHEVTLEGFSVTFPFSTAPGGCGPLPRVLGAGETCAFDLSFASTSPGTTYTNSLAILTQWNPGFTGVGDTEGRSVAPIYVDPSRPPGGTGTSWTDAFDSLEAALPGASSTTPVWVVAGIYRPAATLVLPGGGHLVGSFAAGEIGTIERDLESNRTVLSGDTAGDDLDPDGDGIIADADDLVGTNLTRLLEGGFMTLDGLALTAADGAAGGVAVDAPGGILRNVHVAGHRGPSAIRFGDSFAIVERSRFAGNAGVALRLDGSGDSNGEEAVAITSSEFSGNRTAGDGAAIRAADLRAPMRVVSTLFAGNRAEGAGGAIRLEAGPMNGAVPLTIERSTFSGNEAGTLGGAISAELAAGSVIRESVAWGNDDDMGVDASTQTIDVISGPPMDFATSDVEGSGGSASWDPAFGTDLGGNLDVDPQFVDDVFAAPSAGGDFRLWASSPLLDLGAIEPEEDLDASGAPRLEGVAADLGAFEGGVAGLRGRVWSDLDGDGLQDPGEPGVAGVRVDVSSSETTTTVFTDTEGTWRVADLPDTLHVVTVTRPSSSFGFSPPDAGDDELDSDVDTSGRSAALAVAMAPKVDAGLIAVLFADGFESGDTTSWSGATRSGETRSGATRSGETRSASIP